MFEVDTDDPARVSARIEPYFWDPVTAVLDEEDRACAMGRLTAFRSVRTIIIVKDGALSRAPSLIWETSDNGI